MKTASQKIYEFDFTDLGKLIGKIWLWWFDFSPQPIFDTATVASKNDACFKEVKGTQKSSFRFVGINLRHNLRLAKHAARW
jgi:hypothetical protein